MKLKSWKSFIYNLFLGLLTIITFYFGACCHFNSITFALQKKSAMTAFYSALGNNLGILGAFISIIYFINSFLTIRKILLKDLTESGRLTNIEFVYIIRFLYSSKTRKEIFEPIIADWQEEYFEALFKKEIWKARWINVRYIYAFLGAMWQKSPIGDLIEFIIKFAK